MVTINERHIRQLIDIESQVNYATPPPLERLPFVTIEKDSPVLLSAPHGAITFRKTEKEMWHDEDDYTAGMALLLSELCNVTVIANIWQTVDSDPNYHFEHACLYKQKVRQLVENNGIKWVIDLHGSKKDSEKMGENQLVDLGTRKAEKSLKPELVGFFKNKINEKLKGENLVNENGFPALETQKFMSMTAFCHHVLGIEAVQVEMKPQIRIPLRRFNGSACAKGEDQYPVRPEQVMGMMQALVDFIDHLHYYNKINA